MSKPNPLVSVIITTHNRADLLISRAIPSVLNQTYRNIEIIIVADRCTDNTKEKVMSIYDSRIHYIALDGRPDLPDDLLARWRVASAAPRNKGLESINGEWITLLDDDDEFTQNHIEVLLTRALDGYDLVYGKFAMVNGDGKIIIGKYPPEHGHIGASSFLYSTKYKDIKFNTDANASPYPGDWYLFQKLIDAGANVSFIDDVVYTHYQPVREWEKQRYELENTGERMLPWCWGASGSYEHLHRYAFASEFVKGKSVLDMASGEGYGANILSKSAEFVFGVEINKGCVEHARSKYVRDNLIFFQGSITNVPIKAKNNIDVITCFEAIEHISEHELLLSEVKRLLKDDGIFIVSTPDKAVYSDEPGYNNPYHIKELYFDGLRTLLHRYFKHVNFYGQRVYSGSYIWSLNDYPGTYSEFVICKGDEEFYFTDKKSKEPIYFIAVASDVLQDSYISNSCLIDISDGLTKDLTKDLQEKVSRLNTAIRQSILLQTAQKIQGFIDILLPARTKGRRLYEMTLSLIRIVVCSLIKKI